MKQLNLTGCYKIADAGLQSLASLTGRQLETLNLSCCCITNAGLRALASFTGLKTLEMHRCGKITSVESSAAMAGLKTLSLHC